MSRSNSAHALQGCVHFMAAVLQFSYQSFDINSLAVCFRPGHRPLIYALFFFSFLKTVFSPRKDASDGSDIGIQPRSKSATPCGNASSVPSPRLATTGGYEVYLIWTMPCLIWSMPFFMWTIPYCIWTVHHGTRHLCFTEQAQTFAVRKRCPIYCHHTAGSGKLSPIPTRYARILIEDAPVICMYINRRRTFTQRALRDYRNSAWQPTDSACPPSELRVWQVHT